jgi:hypothetical protein
MTILTIIDLISFVLFMGCSYVWWHLARKNAPLNQLQGWGAASLGFLAFSLICTYALY